MMITDPARRLVSCKGWLCKGWSCAGSHPADPAPAKAKPPALAEGGNIPRYHLSSLLPHGRQPYQVRRRRAGSSLRVLRGYTLTLSRAFPSQPTCVRSAPAPCPIASPIVRRLPLHLPRSVRSSEMYSPPVTTRLSPPGSSLFSLLKVTLSLHSLCLIHLMFRLYKNS